MSNDSNQSHDHGKPDTIHFVVDGEPETTEQRELTAAAIISLSGLDAETNYLEEVAPEKRTFQDNPQQEIELKNGMVFKVKPKGPMPVS